MFGRVAAIVVLLVCWFGIAAADEPKPPPETPADTPPVTTPPAPPDPAKQDAPNPPPPATNSPPASDAPPPATDASPPSGAPSPTTDAPPAATPSPITPPPAATGPTIVTGRVTDVLGRPVRDARVYVLPRRGQPHQTKTSKDGRYKVEVTTMGTHGVVIAIDKAHTFRTVLVQQGVTNTLDIDVELDTEGGEVIKIEDRKRPQPAVKAKPTKDPRISLPYSEEAVERDAWARAWLLLDVDKTGNVTRLKMLKRPGFDLDKIAIEEAFKLRFEPARDAAGYPMETYMLWTMEWPAWGWLVQGNGTAVRKPADVDELHVHAQNLRGAGLDRANWARPSAAATAFPHALARVPCAGSGPLNLDLRNRAYRDCSQPDLSLAESLPWITRETAATAVAEMSAPGLMLVEEGPRGSRVPGYVAAGATGVLAVVTVVSFLRFDKWQQRVEDQAWKATVDPKEYANDVSTRDRWGKITLGMTAATILAGGVTLLVWHRNMPKSSFSVQPSSSGNGGSAMFTMSF